MTSRHVHETKIGPKCVPKIYDFRKKLGTSYDQLKTRLKMYLDGNLVTVTLAVICQLSGNEHS